MIISSNLAAQSAANDLTKTSAALTKSLAKLSSGSRIVNAYDDAAGVAISLRFDAKIERRQCGAGQCGQRHVLHRHAGRLPEAHLQDAQPNRANWRCSPSTAPRATPTGPSTRTSSTSSQNYIAGVGSKEFNGVSLFSASNVQSVIDSEGSVFNMTGVDITSATYSAVVGTPAFDANGNVTSTSGGADISSTSNAATALGNIRMAITQLASDRATVGAFQSRLNMANDQLAATIENFTAASSVIKDVDVARESTEFSRQNILNQSTTAMLAQANQLPSRCCACCPSDICGNFPLVRPPDPNPSQNP
jgi:flagellin